MKLFEIKKKDFNKRDNIYMFMREVIMRKKEKKERSLNIKWRHTVINKFFINVCVHIDTYVSLITDFTGAAV